MLTLLAMYRYYIWQKSHYLNISLLIIYASMIVFICDLRRIRDTIDKSIVYTIATSLINLKVDYCNSFLLNLPAIETNLF